MNDIQPREPQMIDGLKLNDSPKLQDGTPACFIRVFDKAEVRKCVNMIKAMNPQAPASLLDDGFLRIYAPDGDLVFAALPRNEKTFICRLHKEVFQK